MRFTDIELEELDMNMSCGDYVLQATDELIEITNKIRERHGNTDLVGAGYENDVYYTYYLCFDADKREIALQANVAHGEKDDYMCYTIHLLPEEKEMLMWKVIKELMLEMEKIF